MGSFWRFSSWEAIEYSELLQVCGGLENNAEGTKDDGILIWKFQNPSKTLHGNSCDVFKSLEVEALLYWGNRC